MRKNYPLMSKELNDLFQDLYYKLVYLLGYDNDNNIRTYVGLYDEIEIQITTIINNSILFQLTNNNDINQPTIYHKFSQLTAINELRSF